MTSSRSVTESVKESFAQILQESEQKKHLKAMWHFE